MILEDLSLIAVVYYYVFGHSFSCCCFFVCFFSWMVRIFYIRVLFSFLFFLTKFSHTGLFSSFSLQIWYICLGGGNKFSNFAQFDEIFDLQDQSVVRADVKSLVGEYFLLWEISVKISLCICIFPYFLCTHCPLQQLRLECWLYDFSLCISSSDKLGNEEEDKVSIVCDVESIFTHYCKTRHLKYDTTQLWGDIVLPLLAAKMPRDHIYVCFEEILEKYIPRYVEVCIGRLIYLFVYFSSSWEENIVFVQILVMCLFIS